MKQDIRDMDGPYSNQTEQAKENQIQEHESVGLLCQKFCFERT